MARPDRVPGFPGRAFNNHRKDSFIKASITALIALGLAPFAFAQSTSPTSATSSSSTSATTTSASSNGRTDLYHVHFANAAVGKAQELADELKKKDTTLPMPDHV